MTKRAEKLNEALKQAGFPLDLSNLCLSAALGLQQLSDEVGPGFHWHMLAELQEWAVDNLREDSDG